MQKSNSYYLFNPFDAPVEYSWRRRPYRCVRRSIIFYSTPGRGDTHGIIDKIIPHLSLKFPIHEVCSREENGVKTNPLWTWMISYVSQYVLINGYYYYNTCPHSTHLYGKMAYSMKQSSCEYFHINVFNIFISLKQWNKLRFYIQANVNHQNKYSGIS